MVGLLILFLAVPTLFKLSEEGPGSKHAPFLIALLIALVVFVVFYVMLNRTLLGKYAYAIGGNSETARLSGIKVNLERGVLYF